MLDIGSSLLFSLLIDYSILIFDQLFYSKCVSPNYIREVQSKLLEIKVDPNKDLYESLQASLEAVLSIESIGVMKKGCIFLLSEDGEWLEMAVESGLSEEVVAGCGKSSLDPGAPNKCLCERVVQGDDITMASMHIHEEDEHGKLLHGFQPPGMKPHGHNIRKILDPTNGKLLGVLNLYMENKVNVDSRGEVFLEVVTRTLAEIILKSKTEEEKRKMEEERRVIEEQNRIRALHFENDRAGALIMDGNFLISEINPALKKMIQGDSTEGICFDDFGGMIKYLEPFEAESEEETVIKERFQANLVREILDGSKEEEFQKNIYIRSVGGAVRLVRMEAFRADGNGKSYNSLVIKFDPSAEELQRITHLATHDAMTKLPNRALFGDRLNQRIASVERSKSGGKLAYYFIDLNFMKFMNDKISHEFADAAICEAARRIAECFKRKTDTIARVGGDEFKGIADVKSKEEAAAIANATISAFDKPFEFKGVTIPLCVAIGYDIFDPQKSKDVSKLDENSDIAMRNAKRVGKGKYADISREAVNQEIVDATTSHAMSFEEAT